MSCPSANDWDLLAMGVIDDAPADTLKSHAEACSTCRQLCLAARRAHVERLRSYEVFDRDHDPLRDALMAALPAESPAQLSERIGVTRRLGDWIMSINTKSTRRIAAVLVPAACFIVAAIALLSPNHQKSAFAAAIERIRSARTIVAHFEAYMNHSEAPMQSGTLSLSDDYGMRFDMSSSADAFPGIPNVMAMTMIHQPDGPVVLVQPSLNLVMRMHTPDGKMLGWSGGLDQSSPDRFLEGFRKLTGEADSQLGLSMLNGRKVEGFEISARKLGLEYIGRGPAGDDIEPSLARVWVDAKTHLPVRMEVDMVVDAPEPMNCFHVRAVYSDFEFDQTLDPALFVPTIPENAHVFDVKVPAPNEETLLDALRLFAETTERYPTTLDPSHISAELMLVLARNKAVKIDPADPVSALSAEMMEAIMGVTMGCVHVQQLARDGLDPEYFGDIVTPEDKDDTLLRWRLPSGETRVIFGDLRVETLPSSNP